MSDWWNIWLEILIRRFISQEIVLRGEQLLKHKGPGHGLYKSAVICSTFGWLKEASVTMEYGKNYKGYWTGGLFVKQVKIFKF